MPATDAQVFGPVTVNPGFNSTGEKVLLTMNTTLPAGGRNVILAVIEPSTTDIGAAEGTYRLYKGSTLLYEVKINFRLHQGGARTKPVLVMAVDNNPVSNASYSLRIYISVASSASTTVHVQGLVIKTDDAVWGYNTTGVDIASGATATVTSVSANFPTGSKVAIIATAYGIGPTTAAHYFIGSGNVKVKSGATVVSSNQFNIGTYDREVPYWASLSYLETTTSNTQTYSVEVTNGSITTITNYAEIVAFTVGDGAFLDTSSVALSNGSQVTVGNLLTTLQGDVVTIALAAAENTSSSNVTAFNAGDVVLQLNNSATGQINNLVGWFLELNGFHGRSGVLPIFRVDTNVTNPSYQVKMTARAAGINGEAKILAFSTLVVVSVLDSGVGSDTVAVIVGVGESGAGSDAVGVRSTVAVGDLGSGVDAPGLSVLVGDSGSGADTTSVSASMAVSDSGLGSEVAGIRIPITDSGSGSETVVGSATVGISDSGSGTEVLTVGQPTFVDDSAAGSDTVSVVGQVGVGDSGSGAEAIDMRREFADSGSGVDSLVVSVPVSDSGFGADTIQAAGTVPVHDSGAGAEAVSASASVSVQDSGSGVDVVYSPQLRDVADSGSGSDVSSVMVPLGDSGIGTEQVGMAKEIADSGTGIDTTILATHAPVSDHGTGLDVAGILVITSILDSGLGADTVGITASTSIMDSGTGVDAVDILLSIYGGVFIDGVEDVGLHSIPYHDMARDGLPVQMVRRAVDDRVFLGDDLVGDVLVEWEDKVSDIVAGSRVLRVLLVVRLVD